MPPVTKEESDKADQEAKAVKEARHAADVEAKRVADEREATKANLDLILPLRGLARALSPHGAANLAEALDGIANAIASGKKPEALVDIAIALKDADRNWDAMVKRINELLSEDAKNPKTPGK
jgi:phosphate uptake regulator